MPNDQRPGAWRRYTKEERLAMQDRVDRAFAKLRRWSWAIAIPATAIGLGLIGPLFPSPVTFAKVAPMIVVCYLFTWGILWVTGKLGGRYFEVWNLHDGR